MPQSAWNEESSLGHLDSKKMSLQAGGGSQVQAACTLTPHQNYAAVCGSLSSAPTATHQEGLNFPCDLYHGLFCFIPLPCAASLCFSFFRWAPPFCSGDQSDSLQGQATWLTRWCHSPGVKMDGLPIQRAHGPTPVRHLGAAVPNPLALRDLFHGRQFFPWTGVGGTVSGWSGTLHITLGVMAVYLYYYYYISSISDHHGLDPRAWDSPTRLSPEDMLPKTCWLIDRWMAGWFSHRALLFQVWPMDQRYWHHQRVY